MFPQTIVQTCIVHLIRSSTRFVAWVNRKALIADLRRVYAAETEEAALAALAEFEKKWDELRAQMKPAADVAGDTARGLGSALELACNELKTGYERFRKLI